MGYIVDAVDRFDAIENVDSEVVCLEMIGIEVVSVFERAVGPAGRMAKSYVPTTDDRLPELDHVPDELVEAVVSRREARGKTSCCDARGEYVAGL